MTMLRPMLPAPVKRKTGADFSMAAVNIVLLLLLFFVLLGTNLGGQTPGVEPARTTGLPAGPLPEPLIVMTKSGLVLDGSPGTAAEILGRLASSEGPVHVLASGDMAADRLLALTTALNGAGRPVRLLTLDIGR